MLPNVMPHGCVWASIFDTCMLMAVLVKALKQRVSVQELASVGRSLVR